MIKRISKKLNDSFETHGLYIILNNVRVLITREEAIVLTSSADLETLKNTILEKGLQNA